MRPMALVLAIAGAPCDEHASLVSDDQLPLVASLRVIASIQPAFVGEYGRFAEYGADYPASDTGDPIATLFCMVTRRGADGTPEAGWLAVPEVLLPTRPSSNLRHSDLGIR